MQIGGSFPIHIARAYGAKPTHASAPETPIKASALPSRLDQASNDSTQPVRLIDKLIAGQVNQSVDFAIASTPANPAGNALQLYTRAADKIEAATGVLLGRSLDIRG